MITTINRTVLNLCLKKKKKFVTSQSISYFKKQKKEPIKNDSSWQWEVQKDPERKCCYPCKSKKCPKRSWFPRFKKVYVPKDVLSCKQIEPKMTWGEYFSFLLPDKYQMPKAPAEARCRPLMNKKVEGCKTNEICKENNQKHFEGKEQLTLHSEPLGFCQKLSFNKPRPCPPPPYSLPRGVMVKKGICPLKGKTDPRTENHHVSFPYNEFKQTRMNLNSLEGKPFKLRCTKACKRGVKNMGDKSLRLSCRSYAGLKSVECPKQVFTRYKSVDIPPTTCEELRPIRPISASAINFSKLRPRRGCPDHGKLQTRDFHIDQSKPTADQSIEKFGKLDKPSSNFPKSLLEVTNSFYQRSYTNNIEETSKHFVDNFFQKKALFNFNSDQIENQKVNVIGKLSLRKFAEVNHSLHRDQPNSSIFTNILQKRGFHGLQLSEHCFVMSIIRRKKSSSTSDFSGMKNKGKREDPKGRGRSKLNCKINVPTCGKENENKKVKSDKPFQVCRNESHSICNKPRKIPQKKFDEPFHPSLYDRMSEKHQRKKENDPANEHLKKRYGTFPFNRKINSPSLLLLTKISLSTSTRVFEKNEKELKKNDNEEVVIKRVKFDPTETRCWVKAKAREEEERQKKSIKKIRYEDVPYEEPPLKFSKFDPYNVERESCFPKPQIVQRKAGIICKLASAIGIGCGKK